MHSLYENIATLWKKLKTDKVLRNNLIKTILVSILFFWVLFYLGSEAKEANFLTQEKIQHFILRYGYFSWLMYIGVLLITILSPLPDTPVVLAGGFIFGPYIAIPLTIIGQLLGATADFYLARKLGRNFVTKKFPKATATLNAYSHSLGWQTVFLMRLTPTLSFDILSYAAGLSTIRYKPYILATLCGMTPLVIITSLLGYSAGLHSKILPILILGIGAIVVTGMFLLFKRIQKNKYSRSS
jgi:uncharacterized membrane protein YdjX (TVP38/TMEM64 family)